jgi:hypothetical protein
MPWRPSTDLSIARATSSQLWLILHELFNATVALDPVKRGEYDDLSQSYVRQRKGDHFDPGVLREQLPRALQELDLGETDVQLAEFILKRDRNRVLNLEGPRGAGKTSTIHFVESALTKAGFAHRLIILDGLGLLEFSDASPSQFIALLHSEALAMATVATPALRKVLRAIATATRRGTDFNKTVERIASAVRSLSDKRLLTVVFDNLDHLPQAFSTVATEFAKVMYVRTGIGAIMCLRPATRTALYQTTSARAFFGWYLSITPPRVPEWMRAIGRRMCHAAEISDTPIAPHPTLGALSPTNIQSIFDRFATLLDASRPGDTVLSMLDAISANDTRHLQLLIRRMLMHRTLPERYLVTGEGSSEFHPIPALIEGEQLIYQSSTEDPIVPNLLWFSWGDGDPELLLPHHLLALLDSKPVPTRRVVEWLQEFEYTEDTIVACLKSLADPLLIALTDREVWGDGQWPEALYLTQAGDYYRNHFLRFTDYLALVVTDVPLNHVAFRRSPTDDLFAPRLLSLAEYTEEVRRRENRQIGELMKRPATSRLRRVAASLDRGGLLTSALLDGLRQGIDRGRNSKSSEVRAVVNKLQPHVKRLESWLESSEERLREVTNRGRKNRAITLETTPFRKTGGTIDIGVMALGDDLRLDATMRSDMPLAAAFVAVRTVPDHELAFGQATLLTPPAAEGLQKYSLRGMFSEIGMDQLPPMAALRVDSISLAPNAHRLALLCVNESGGAILNITLHTFDGNGRMVELGGPADAIALERWSSDRLNDIGGRLLAGTTFSERVYSMGVLLAERLLSSSGRNELAAYLSQIEHLVVCSNRLSIPWEWMVPRSLTDSSHTVAIGDACRVTRWPWNPVDGVIRVLNSPTEQSRLLPLCTIGLPKSQPWRSPSPANIKDLQTSAKSCATLHLVGHWSAVRKSLSFNGGKEFDLQDASGHPLRGPQRIIVSGCDAPADTMSNLVSTLSAVAGVPSWAPLVTIREMDADRLDIAVAAHRGTLDDFMMSREDPDSLNRLYVRYGLPG